MANVVFQITWKVTREEGLLVRARLNAGAARNLYQLVSWDVTEGEASAYLTPLASLDEIGPALFSDSKQLLHAGLMMTEQEPQNDQAGWNSQHPRHDVFHANLRRDVKQVNLQTRMV